MADETVLTITGVGVPPYSARGLRQSLEPIGAAASLRRTVNGALVDIGASQFRKYRTSISGEDQDPPAIDGIWPGLEVEIGCIAEIATDSPSGGDRNAVPGSERTSGGFTVYRPRLIMLITNFNVDKDEYEAITGWRLDAEEV